MPVSRECIIYLRKNRNLYSALYEGLVDKSTLKALAAKPDLIRWLSNETGIPVDVLSAKIAALS
jgi:hypothetical protein